MIFKIFTFSITVIKVEILTVFLYLRMSLRDAHNHVRSCRSVIRPNIGFWRQLIDYEKRIRGKKSVKMIQSSMGLIPDVYQQESRSMIAWLGRSRR